MTMSKSMARGLSLQARLEKLADSKDEKVASKAVSDLVTLHISEAEIEAREDRIMPLRAEVAELKKKLTAAEETLSPVTTERDALLTEVSGLREQAAKFVTMETELATCKSGMDEWKAEQRKLLTDEAQQHRWKAERAENATKDILAEAREKFGQAGLQLLLDEMQKLVQQYNIPEPDPASLPRGISPLFLTAWGRTPKFSSLALAFSRYTEPTQGFKEQLYRVLSVGLPVAPTLIMPSIDEQLRNENAQPHYVYPKPDEVPDLAERREVLTKMAIKFGCLQEVQTRVDQRHAEILGQQRQENTAALQQQQTDLARMGYGRESIASAEPVSSVPLSEHLPGCRGSCCNGGRLVRFANSLDEEAL